jgi:arabinogalactan endo-1,4-beta-galactosidase
MLLSTHVVNARRYIQIREVSMPMYLGADMSYVNEIEDCGGVYFDKGQLKDPFLLLRDYGANIVRVRP